MRRTSGRVRWMISAMTRAWGLSGVDRSAARAPALERLRLALKVAKRTGSGGRPTAATGRAVTINAKASSNSDVLRIRRLPYLVSAETTPPGQAVSGRTILWIGNDVRGVISDPQNG